MSYTPDKKQDTPVENEQTAPPAVIFISPNYPGGHYRYVAALRRLGAEVFGIGDAGYETFRPELRGNLSEYYRVGDLHNYEEVYRAVAFFIHKHGRMFKIESLNPYWRQLEARLREDYKVEGLTEAETSRIDTEDKLLSLCALSGVPIAPSLPNAEEEKLRGTTVVCCGVTDESGEILLARAFDIASDEGAGEEEEQSPPLTVFSSGDEAAVLDHSRKLAEQIGAGASFFEFTFKKLAAAVKNMGKKGTLVLSSAKLAPPCGLLCDCVNYSCGGDIAELWAGCVLGERAVLPVQSVSDEEIRSESREQTEGDDISREHAANANSSSPLALVSRRFDRSFKNSHEKILRRLGAKIYFHGRIDEAMRRESGDYVYIFKGASSAEIRRNARFISEDFDTHSKKYTKLTP
ncbi:MAG: hypothetical protein LBL82_06540 [Oscillospiraceae bacterium]|jgi:hypothetical protein|nr:hypothetical protein [Oscillospiraceae bacterium]